ncbi:MAG: hypothetical protein MUF49_30675 [Oculatellaceae cyanobacterium Prado106]|nr:hypothetical protein [Oculatellaceae cyanobacterium Prado106]
MSFQDGGNSFQQATRLGLIRFASMGSAVTSAGLMAPGETVDWYQARTKGRSSGVRLTFQSVPAINQILEVYFRPASKAQGRGKRVATIAGGSVDQRNLKAQTGTYFFKVSQVPGTVANEEPYTFTLASLNPGAFRSASKKASSSSRSTPDKSLFF